MSDDLLSFPESPATSRRRRRRRHLRGSLPDRPAVELNRETVGGIDRPLVRTLNPNAARVVHPTSGGLAAIVHHVEFPAVLSDEGKLALQAGCAQLHA